jgi:hypothetical protein
METPASIVKDETSYKPAAWHDYSIQELGNWVHLFAKRSGMRSDKAKAMKDLADAQAYLDMIQSHLNDAKAKM